MTMTTDRLTQAIDALATRIEPRMSRHPVTVVQHAGSVIYRIGEAMDCQFEDGDDLVAAVKELVRERDEARLELAGLPAWQHACEQSRRDLADAEAEVDRLRKDIDDAYRRGAEAMRADLRQLAEACEAEP